jgi:hypothetical protein
VQIAKLVAAQMQREMAAGGGPSVAGSIGMGSPGMPGATGAPGAAAGSTTKSGLIIPD